jgi:hypothetical protein
MKSLIGLVVGVLLLVAPMRVPANQSPPPLPGSCWIPTTTNSFLTLLSPPCQTVVGTVIWTSGDVSSADGDFDIWIIPDSAYNYLIDPNGTELIELQTDVPKSKGLIVPPDLGNHLPAPGTRIEEVGLWIHNDTHNWNAIDPVEALCFWTATTAPVCSNSLIPNRATSQRVRKS